MTTKQENTTRKFTLPEAEANRFENVLRARLGLDPRGAILDAQVRLYGWILTAVVGLLAAIVRFVRLDHPNELIFDETYYVKGGYSMLHWGYERDWSDAKDLNERFISAVQNGTPFGDILKDNPDRWVHPPFGKWLICEGMRIAGDSTGYGWRFTTAVCGVLMVMLTVRIALKLFRSIPLAGIAGVFLALDGLALTMSRTGLLDNMLALFVLAGFWAVLKDREWSRARLAHRVAHGKLRRVTPEAEEPATSDADAGAESSARNAEVLGDLGGEAPRRSLAELMVSRARSEETPISENGVELEPEAAKHSDPNEPTAQFGTDFTGLAPADPWGPGVFYRPWILVAAVFLGLTTSVKWSGLYAIAVFGLAIFAWGLAARKAVGARLWIGAGTFREGLPAFVQLVPPALVTYIVAFIPWFVNPNGWDRQWATNQIAQNATLPASEQVAMPLSWAPDVVNSWLHWHIESYTFHTGLSSPHTYQSQAWEWLVQWRPVSFYWKGTDAMPKDACWGGDCVGAITSIGNPVMWWAALAALFVVVAMAFIRRDWRAWAILAGYLALWAPWLNYTNRTIFQFYAVAFVPFVVLALVYGLAWMTDMLPARLPASAGTGRFAGVLKRLGLRFGADDAGRVTSETDDAGRTPASGVPEGSGTPDAEPAAQAPKIMYGTGFPNRASKFFIGIVAAVIVAFSLFWLPLWVGMPVPHWFWQAHMWLPSWI